MSSSSHNHSLAYRAEVDGLRALAVVPVVLFHAGIAGFAGGFVGVDVFFVISGYLITAILAKEIAAGQFSTLRFYERRIRRLFPALIVMFAVCWAVAMFLLMPQDFRSFGRSMVASGLFSSNILFWAEGGYFDTSAELKPLLHTWSLSVEEQFYIVFPALLLVLLTKVRQWKAVLTVLLLASFAACVYYTPTDPDTAFYLPMFRVWELLAGSFVALSIGFFKIRNDALRSAAAMLGVALVLWATFTFDASTSFPGVNALFPCIGAALIIAYSQQTVVATVLGSKPLVWIGKLSYSLYLWHWPIIVFAKYYLMRELEISEQYFVVALSLAAAYLSMRFVEIPFRDRKFAADTRSLFKMAAVPMVCFFMAGLGTYFANGFPERFADPVQAMAMGARDTNPQRRDCDGRDVEDIAAGNVCLVGAPGDKPTFAVLGDSFGDAMMPGIAAAASSAGRQGMVLTSSGCYPLEGVVDLNKHGDVSCREFVSASLALIQKTPSITDVILVGRWTTAALGVRFGVSAKTGWYINDTQSVESSYAENKRVFDRALTRTVTMLDGKRVHIVSYVPEQRIDPPRTLALCAYLSRDCPTGVSFAEFEQRHAFIRETINRITLEKNARVIDVGSKLCTDKECAMVANGTMLYSDDNHLSSTGALYIRDLFKPAFSSKEYRASSNVVADKTRH
ncbi:acyltransferase family protein [Pseudoduganella umbonata]|uniref:Acyltransferase n=1 Tax=Pseudoduganella umbonata TaxID=864828 RepID=A0A4V1EDX0_9BURK|nr:acyltransferase family protein [Pseudoduganella umbonata]MBB3222335.1 peptidoglycan/LPS O-acetylase OafA/YrhL [Pseudoduganella umbonata]QCP12551.1 acyltransferase [Pseudoduganella umbonata]